MDSRSQDYWFSRLSAIVEEPILISDKPFVSVLSFPSVQKGCEILSEKSKHQDVSAHVKIYDLVIFLSMNNHCGDSVVLFHGGIDIRSLDRVRDSTHVAMALKARDMTQHYGLFRTHNFIETQIIPILRMYRTIDIVTCDNQATVTRQVPEISIPSDDLDEEFDDEGLEEDDEGMSHVIEFVFMPSCDAACFADP